MNNQMYNNQVYNNQMYNAPQNNKKSNKGIIILIIIIVLLVVGGIFVYTKVIDNKDTKEPEVVEEKKEEKPSNSNEEEKEEPIVEEEEKQEEYEVEDIYPELEKNLKSNDPLTVGIALWDYATSVALNEDSVWQRYIDNDTQKSVCKISVDEIKKRFTTNFKANGAIYNNSSIDEFVGQCEVTVRETDENYIDTNFDLKSKTSNQIILKATSTYCESYGCETKKVSKTIEKDFIIKKVNGSWKIASFYMPY